MSFVYDELFIYGPVPPFLETPKLFLKNGIFNFGFCIIIVKINAVITQSFAVYEYPI